MTYIVRSAEQSDLRSLGTVFARAFHPTKPFQRQLNPDTPLMREWWRKVQSSCMADRNEHLLVVSDLAKEGEVVGFLNMHHFGPEERGCGLWSNTPVCEDQDKEIWDGLMEALAVEREKQMMGTSHIVIMILGVDDKYHGRGLGKLLMQRCCEIADKEGVSIFVEAGGYASTFYPRFGFELVNSHIAKGSSDYNVSSLIRKPGAVYKDRTEEDVAASES